MGLESLCLKNAFFTQCLVDCTIAGLGAVWKSFENVLDQMEHFHHLLCISREQVWPDQIFKDGDVVSLLE